MTEMVRAELELESIGRGLAPRRRHDRGVVDQEVQGLPARTQPRAEVRDGLKVREIDRLELHDSVRNMLTNARDRLRAFRAVPAGDDDLSAGPCERERDLVAQAAGTGDDGVAANL
jgi:hypothetical protein